MTDITQRRAGKRGRIQASYMAQVQRRRLYGGLTLLIFVVLMVSGFQHRR
jgi:phosphonate transport system permease protein